MSSPANNIITRFGWELDTQSQKRVLKAFADFKKAAEKGLDDKAIDRFGKRFGKLAQEIGLPEDALEKLSNELLKAGGNLGQIEKFGRAFQGVASDVNKATGALADYEKRRRQLDESGGALSGNLASTFANSRGAIDTLSGGNAGAAGVVLELGEAIADLGEFGPRAVNELGALGRAINESSGFFGKLAGGFSALIPGLSGTAAGLAAVAVPLGVIAAIGAGVALVLNQINNEIERQVELEKQRSAIFDAEINAQSEANQALDELNGERIKSQLEAALEEERIATERAANIAQRARELEIEQQRAAQGLDIASVATLGARISELNNEFETAANEAQIAATTTQVWREAAEKYEAAGGDAAMTTAELVEQTNKLKAEQAQLAAIEQQAADATAQYNKETRRIAEERNIAAIREEEDFNERVADIREAGAKRIADIEKQGQARLAKIRSQLSDLPRQLTEDLADAERKAAEERQDILTDYTTDANRAWEDFWRREAQIQRKAQLDRLRLEEDFRDRLNDAAAGGDVEAFLRAEREREKALQRQAEDIGEEAQTRADDFTAEQEQRRQDLARRLEELRTSLAQERSEITLSYEQRRTELLEALEAEKVALKENLDAAYAAIAEQEKQLAEQRKKTLERQREDEKRADAERDRQHREDLAKINERALAIKSEARSTDDLVKGAQKLAVAASAVKSAMSSLGNSSSIRSGSSSSRSGKSATGGISTRIGFATGGLAIATPGGIPARLAENENELVIPVGNAAGTGAAVEALNKLGGMTGARGYSAGVSITVHDSRTVIVGDIARISDVEDALVRYDAVRDEKLLIAVDRARTMTGVA